MTENVEYIVNTLMSVDRANQVVIESMEEFENCNQEKVKEAKELIEQGYRLLIQSVQA